MGNGLPSRVFRSVGGVTSGEVGFRRLGGGAIFISSYRKLVTCCVVYALLRNGSFFRGGAEMVALTGDHRSTRGRFNDLALHGSFIIRVKRSGGFPRVRETSFMVCYGYPYRIMRRSYDGPRVTSAIVSNFTGILRCTGRSGTRSILLMSSCVICKRIFDNGGGVYRGSLNCLSPASTSDTCTRDVHSTRALTIYCTRGFNVGMGVTHPYPALKNIEVDSREG